MQVIHAAGPALDPDRCPLCGQSNQCAMQVQRTTGVTQPPCWCSRTSFDPALLASVPQQLRDKACICPVCAQIKAV
jgi:hypothetical protein